MAGLDDAIDAELFLARWVARDGVEVAEQFGWQVLMDGRRAFAVVANGRIGVKLPKPRRQELQATGTVEPLIDHQGRPLTEWVAVVDAAAVDALVAESRAHIADTPRRRRKRS